MALSIGVNIHAVTSNDPKFTVYRQEGTGVIVLEIEGTGPGGTGAAVFLDDNTLDDLAGVLVKADV